MNLILLRIFKDRLMYNTVRFFEHLEVYVGVFRKLLKVVVFNLK
jgi:hypothetical protein